jgi:4-amino-4-deoxy-L-arabinose transferase-like glycosyltransferase
VSVAELSQARGERTFWLGLGAIALAALGIRIAAAFWYDAQTQLGGDAVWYVGVAGEIANGNGFLSPGVVSVFREQMPTAAHPPVYPLFLSVIDLFGSDSIIVHRLWSCVPGTATVVLAGLTGREIASDRAGLLAAALTATFASLVIQDVMLWSEGMYAFTIALVTWLAFRFLRRPTFLTAGLLGAAIGLAALTRGEGVLLFLVLFVPLVLRLRSLSTPFRWQLLGVGAGVVALLLAPWLIYNNSGRFTHPVGITVTFGTLIGSSNCNATYYGREIGGWGGLCADTVPQPWPLDESEAERAARDAGFEYASEHLEQLPLVIPFRLARSFGFYDPVEHMAEDLLLNETGTPWVAYTGTVQYWVLLGFSIWGVVVLARRRVSLIPFVSQAVTVAVITVVGYGTMRFRIALDVLLPILAGVALDAIWVAQRARTNRAAEPAGTVAG